ncbi:DUF4870 domain-containing protein [Phycicoccus duodecadis]|uniref:Tic20 family protein n=1 Tax=Phycicoccus duodecadis TaxID=173053 RepID=A0A2N3YMZ8_9MICO|nr:DUF4870 domain-containing protein [Phycicoccus duodecadis]PKW28179.1 hypothetical protein ATL31_3037 [Phycicoccus duodecadis]
MSDTTPHDDRPQGEPTEVVTPPPPPVSDRVELGKTTDTPPPPPFAAPTDATPPPPPYPSGQLPPPPPATPPAYGPPAAAPLSPQEEKTWGMLSHVIGAVAMVASAGFLGFVGSLVIYVMYKDRGPFVRAHAANSLNVQIAAFIGSVIGWILTITIIGALIGIPILIVVFVGALILHVLGAVKANNGEWWNPPLVPTFVR